MTVADWTRIPKLAIKHLDFEIASDGKRVVQEEAKGTVVENNRKKPSGVSNHAADIAEKKKGTNDATQNQTDPFPAMIRYGTIAAIDANSSHNVRCWVLDPEPAQLEGSPKDMRVIKRLQFMLNVLTLLVPYAEITLQLKSRVTAMVSDNKRSFDSVPLEVGVAPPNSSAERCFLFRNVRDKAVSKNEPFGGVLFPATRASPTMFIGIRMDLLHVIVRQGFRRD